VDYDYFEPTETEIGDTVFVIATDNIFK
jgi:hypothetical protein